MLVLTLAESLIFGALHPPRPSNSTTTASTRFPSPEDRSHFRSSRRTIVTLTSSPRSSRTRPSSSTAPVSATLPASDTSKCKASSASNSGIGSFHRCF